VVIQFHGIRGKTEMYKCHVRKTCNIPNLIL